LYSAPLEAIRYYSPTILSQPYSYTQPAAYIAIKGPGLTAPAGKPMPIVIPSYNGARKQANLTPLLAMLLHKLGFPVVVHGVSHDPTRVLTETIFTLL
ncbi:hypothetical protein JTM29_36440, partial [Pseudomonas aeruginosa]|nr:hypothetical protein [Pseudomonas aeruginosa]